MELDGKLLIVVGATLRAEIADRPLAYGLHDRVRAWVTRHEASLRSPVEPVVCSDLWYLNHGDLQARPTVCIGGPGVNALSRYLATQLPEEVKPGAAEPKVLIQVDPDFTDLRVCIWGSDHALTAKGVSLFVERYLDGYLRAVATQVEPEG